MHKDETSMDQTWIHRAVENNPTCLMLLAVKVKFDWIGFLAASPLTCPETCVKQSSHKWKTFPRQPVGVQRRVDEICKCQRSAGFKNAELFSTWWKRGGGWHPTFDITVMYCDSSAVQEELCCLKTIPDTTKGEDTARMVTERGIDVGQDKRERSNWRKGRSTDHETPLHSKKWCVQPCQIRIWMELTELAICFRSWKEHIQMSWGRSPTPTAVKWLHCRLMLFWCYQGLSGCKGPKVSRTRGRELDSETLTDINGHYGPMSCFSKNPPAPVDMIWMLLCLTGWAQRTWKFHGLSWRGQHCGW